MTEPQATAPRQPSPKSAPGSSSPTPQTPPASAASSAEPNRKSEPAAHLVLQGKGGVGKTFVASLLAQYLGSKGQSVQCIDTDPVNASLHEIKGLTVEKLELFKSGTDEVDFRALDGLINRLVERPGTYVVDNGAASFKPVSTYLFEQGILDTLIENGVAVTLHLVIATGPEIIQTISGAESIIQALPRNSSVKVVLWLNEHRGPIETFTDGATLEESEFYQERRHQLAGVVTIPHQTRAAAENVATLLARQVTFEEAMSGDAFYLVEKSRLRAFRDTIYAAIAQARVG